MLNRFSALCLVFGLAAGYAIASPSARAQGPEGLPFIVEPGDTLRLHFERGALVDTVTSLDCVAEELQGSWLRCRATETSFQAQRQQRWFNLKYVPQVTKLPK